MKAKLTYTDNYALIVDESDIKEGDWFYSPATKEALDASKDMLSWNNDTTQEHKGWKKITWHIPLNGLPELDGVPLLPPMESYEKMVEVLAENTYKQKQSEGHYELGGSIGETYFCDGFYHGYNKAKEKYKYTEEDIEIAIKKAVKLGNLHDPIKAVRDITYSLQQPKMPTEFEFEMVEKCCGIMGGTNKNDELTSTCDICSKRHNFQPKTITLPNGRPQAVGRYY